MPLTNEEWKDGRTWQTLESQVLAFLKKNQKPYNINEIVYGLGFIREIKDFWSFLGGIGSYWSVQNALEKLVREGTVEAKKIKQPIGEEIYYKAVST
jgi:hypothetical protein